MTETAEPRNVAQDTVAMTAATMGHDIVAALLNELRKMPGHWPTLAAEYQQKTIEEFKTKVSDMVRKSISFMLTSDFQAVAAKLEYVGRKKGIQAALSVSTTAMYRHALFDAQGQNVLVVIADPEKWLGRMDEIKARGDQLDLFDAGADYDPKRDQPGYRRDQDPLAPGKTWDELKRSLQIGGTKPAEGETKPPDGDTAERPKVCVTFGDDPDAPGNCALCGQPREAHPDAPPPVVVASSLTPEQEHEATLRMLQEELAGIGIVVSLGLLQARGDADILAATCWVEAYRENAGDAKEMLERPAWLPEPGAAK